MKMGEMEVTQTPSPNSEEIGKIESALSELLDQMVAIDMRPRVGPPEPLRVVSASEFEFRPVPTRRDCQINSVLNQPVRAACRNAIRLLGERLFELTNDTDGQMLKVAERASDGPQFGRRMSIMNSAWDGVGHWHA
jgi:hypothetical protein